MERVWVVIPAGGRGQRFGAAQAKQYVLLRGRPVIAHTLAAFFREPRVAGIQLVLPGEDIATGGWRELLGPTQEPFLSLSSAVLGVRIRCASVWRRCCGRGQWCPTGCWCMTPPGPVCVAKTCYSCSTAWRIRPKVRFSPYRLPIH